LLTSLARKGAFSGSAREMERLNGSGDDDSGVVVEDEVAFPQISQEWSWDCGIACLKMVFHAHAFESKGKCSVPSTEEVLESIGGTSVWTIDLALALHSLGQTKFVFHTKNLRPDAEDYVGMNFYNDAVADCMRATEKFEFANELDVQVVQGSVHARKIKVFLNEDPLNCAIVLLDARLMTQNANEKNCMLGALFENQKEQNIEYRGHYCIFIGFRDGFFLFRDPSYESSHPLLMSEEIFETARKARGTDEDIIFIWGPEASRL